MPGVIESSARRSRWRRLSPNEVCDDSDDGNDEDQVNRPCSDFEEEQAGEPDNGQHQCDYDKHLRLLMREFSRKTRSRFRRDNEDRARRVPQDCVGHAAEQGPFDPTATVTSDHYQICWPILGGLHDLCGGVADWHKLPSWSLVACTTRYAREQSLCVLFGHRNKFARRDPALNAKPYCGIDYMDQCYIALQRVGELHPTLVGACRNRTGIDG